MSIGDISLLPRACLGLDFKTKTRFDWEIVNLVQKVSVSGVSALFSKKKNLLFIRKVHNGFRVISKRAAADRRSRLLLLRRALGVSLAGNARVDANSGVWKKKKRQFETQRGVAYLVK